MASSPVGPEELRQARNLLRAYRDASCADPSPKAGHLSERRSSLALRTPASNYGNSEDCAARPSVAPPWRSASVTRSPPASSPGRREPPISFSRGLEIYHSLGFGGTDLGGVPKNVERLQSDSFLARGRARQVAVVGPADRAGSCIGDERFLSLGGPSLCDLAGVVMTPARSQPVTRAGEGSASSRGGLGALARTNRNPSISANYQMMGPSGGSSSSTGGCGLRSDADSARTFQPPSRAARASIGETSPISAVEGRRGGDLMDSPCRKERRSYTSPEKASSAKRSLSVSALGSSPPRELYFSPVKGSAADLGQGESVVDVIRRRAAEARQLPSTEVPELPPLPALSFEEQPPLWRAEGQRSHDGIGMLHGSASKASPAFDGLSPTAETSCNSGAAAPIVFIASMPDVGQQARREEVPSEHQDSCASSSCQGCRGTLASDGDTLHHGTHKALLEASTCSLCCQCGVQQAGAMPSISAIAIAIGEVASPAKARTPTPKSPTSPLSAPSLSGRNNEARPEVTEALRDRVAMLEELLRQGSSPPKGHRATGSADPVPGLKPRPVLCDSDATGEGPVSAAPTPSAEVAAVECTPLKAEAPVPPPKGKGKGKGKTAPPPPPAEAASSPGQPSPGGKGKGKAAPPKAPSRGAPTSPTSGKVSAKSQGPVPRKAEVKPRLPMKRLFWNSFLLEGPELEKPETTVWAAIEKDGFIDDIDVEELELLFAEALPGRNQTSSDGMSGSCRKGLAQKSRLFEETRRRQVCVMLARLPDIETTITSVLDMDDRRLDKDQVELLLANAPPAEELTALQSAAAELAANHKDDSPPWDVAESFVLRLGQVPFFAVRLQIWSFENSFEERLEVFQTAGTEVQEACIALRQSASMQRLLGLALGVGNYLNAGTSRGRADGFAVEALAQMRTVKAVPQGPTKTIVDYLVQQMEKTRPGDLDGLFSEDCLASAIHRAARHKLSDLSQELAAFRNQAESIARRASAADDRALSVRAERVEARHAELLALQKLFANAEEEYKRLCAWFHEGAAKPARPSDEFFSVWDGFLQAVRAALEGLYGGRTRRRKSNFRQRKSLDSLKTQLSLDGAADH